jgi:signal transduction histidine kinase/CHASE1-domain containing sensor protein/CheY-like chemotaxis protein
LQVEGLILIKQIPLSGYASLTIPPGMVLRRRVLRHFGFPLAVLLIGAGATATVAVQMRRTVEVRDLERFEVAADQLQDGIHDRLSTYVSILRAGAGLLAAEEVPTARQFGLFADRLELQTRYPGIQGIGYSARIQPDELAGVIAAQQRSGNRKFNVWPGFERPEYHAILYLQPLDRRNLAAIGYDMFTNPTRRAAMEAARDSGEARASGPVTLVQEIDEVKQPGFLIYMPVYRGGAVPRTVELRRERLQGFVYSPFRAGDLFAGILGRNPRGRAGFELFDGEPSHASLLHQTPNAHGPGRFSRTRTLDIAGREWTLRMYSTPSLDASSSLVLVPFVTWSGLAISALLAGLALLQTRARRRAEDSEASAAAQAETLEALNRSGARLAGELDLERLVQVTIDAATQLTRAQFGAFFHKTASDIFPVYTLSGISKQAFAGLPAPRETALFGPTFRGERVIRSDDITRDPLHGRNAPFAGMPPGHPPVRSYLAVPVQSRSGEVLGGLLFGHAERGVFTEQAERIVRGIAAQAAIAIDNARLYGQVQRLLTSEREARTEAERVSSLKDEFLATLSHELRTPLNAVIGWAHMLSAGTVAPDKRGTAIDTILRNARIQSQLIEDLLDMSRIISGRVRIQMTRLDVREVVAASINVVRPTADAKNITIGFTAAPGTHMVQGDADRLQQVMWNLLSNALKFTGPGGQVIVTLARRGAQVEICISDTGIGIEPHFLPYVFERFRQADGSSTRDHGGLGLGLSIARSLVEMHAGSNYASSAGLNHGASFTVRLPAAPTPTADAAGDRRVPLVSIAQAGLSGLSILVVDDDQDARTLLAEMLAQNGARVLTADSGYEALRILESGDHRVELLICDIGMPRMDGYELIQRVRTLPAGSGAMIPAVALTAYASAEDRLRATSAGYDLHAAKPITPEQIVAACVSLVRGNEV